MQLTAKEFDELTTEELFEIYKLRVSVFVVEQKCPYQEVDDDDRKSCHVMLKDLEDIKAYLRIIPDEEQKTVHLGRVIAVDRRCGLGTAIVSEGIRLASEKYHAETIQLEAQLYAVGLYEKLGFMKCSDEFSLDGILHVKMILDLTKNS